MKVTTNEMQQRGITFQVAPVKRIRLSVGKLNDAGNDVSLNEKKLYIYNVATGEYTFLRKVNGMFIMDLWIKKDDFSVGGKGGLGFTRRG